MPSLGPDLNVARPRHNAGASGERKSRSTPPGPRRRNKGAQTMGTSTRSRSRSRSRSRPRSHNPPGKTTESVHQKKKQNNANNKKLRKNAPVKKTSSTMEMKVDDAEIPVAAAGGAGGATPQELLEAVRRIARPRGDAVRDDYASTDDAVELVTVSHSIDMEAEEEEEEETTSAELRDRDKTDESMASRSSARSKSPLCTTLQAEPGCDPTLTVTLRTAPGEYDGHGEEYQPIWVASDSGVLHWCMNHHHRISFLVFLWLCTGGVSIYHERTDVHGGWSWAVSVGATLWYLFIIRVTGSLVDRHILRFTLWTFDIWVIIGTVLLGDAVYAAREVELDRVSMGLGVYHGVVLNLVFTLMVFIVSSGIDTIPNHVLSRRFRIVVIFLWAVRELWATTHLIFVEPPGADQDVEVCIDTGQAVQSCGSLISIERMAKAQLTLFFFKATYRAIENPHLQVFIRANINMGEPEPEPEPEPDVESESQGYQQRRKASQQKEEEDDEAHGKLTGMLSASSTTSSAALLAPPSVPVSTLTSPSSPHPSHSHRPSMTRKPLMLSSRMMTMRDPMVFRLRTHITHDVTDRPFEAVLPITEESSRFLHWVVDNVHTRHVRIFGVAVLATAMVVLVTIERSWWSMLPATAVQLLALRIILGLADKNQLKLLVRSFDLYIVFVAGVAGACLAAARLVINNKGFRTHDSSLVALACFDGLVHGTLATTNMCLTLSWPDIIPSALLTRSFRLLCVRLLLLPILWGTIMRIVFVLPNSDVDYTPCVDVPGKPSCESFISVELKLRAQMLLFIIKAVLHTYLYPHAMVWIRSNVFLSEERLADDRSNLQATLDLNRRLAVQQRLASL